MKLQATGKVVLQHYPLSFSLSLSLFFLSSQKEQQFKRSFQLCTLIFNIHYNLTPIPLKDETKAKDLLG